MPKNIVVFSDGTGQDGGARPEQRLSNIFKMYRVCKTGPENAIDPSEQVAFYDPGLGTDIGASAMTAPVRFAQKMAASLSGRGITTNIADCYAFIVNHYEEGDRIYLLGFSRGAYTVRCVANLLMLCGVPTRAADGGHLLRFRKMTRDIAREAVDTVLEHGAGHPRKDYDAERQEMARRFRNRYGSVHRDGGDLANVAPYFIGTFDTVAALGVSGAKRTVIQAVIAAAIGIPSTLAIVTTSAGIAGLLHLALGVPFWSMAAALVAVAVGVSAIVYDVVRHRLKLARTKTITDYPTPGESRSHEARWEGDNFDKLLSAQVGYARSAIAIDESREDFARVKWGPTAVPPPREHGLPPMLIQMWFAGNHSDIGGSYEETESRLSDIALKWMLEQAVGIPDGLKVGGMPAVEDWRDPKEVMEIPRLRLFPSPAGVQHCEVAGMRDTIEERIAPWYVPEKVRAWARGKNWAVLDRPRPKNGATLHPSVAERLALDEVQQCDGKRAYRPPLVKGDPAFARLYGP